MKRAISGSSDHPEGKDLKIRFRDERADFYIFNGEMAPIII